MVIWTGIIILGKSRAWFWKGILQSEVALLETIAFLEDSAACLYANFLEKEKDAILFYSSDDIPGFENIHKQGRRLQIIENKASPHLGKNNTFNKTKKNKKNLPENTKKNTPWEKKQRNTKNNILGLLPGPPSEEPGFFEFLGFQRVSPVRTSLEVCFIYFLVFQTFCQFLGVVDDFLTAMVPCQTHAYGAAGDLGTYKLWSKFTCKWLCGMAS